MTMTHQDRLELLVRQELGRDERTTGTTPSPLTLERPSEHRRRWSVAQLVAAARVPGDHSTGA